MKLFDCHTHVQFAAFTEDYREVIKRSLDNGVKMITVGTQRDTSRRAVEVANEFDGVWAAVGLHPIHTDKSYHDPKELGAVPLEISHPKVAVATPPKAEGGFLTGFTSRGEDFDYEYYKNLAMDPKVVAIGECGLDYFRIENNELRIKNKQKEVFLKQIELAKELNKPLMIHARPSKGTDDAYQDISSIIHYSSFIIPKVSHFYAGSLEMAKRLAEAGFYFTFGGVITFARDYDEVIKYLPLDRIMLETDAPYLAPELYRGKRNEPAYVVETAKKLAEIKGMSFNEVVSVTNLTVKKVFGIT